MFNRANLPAQANTAAMPQQMPQQAMNAGQYGANASPNGNGWGQAFMQQYGAPPGQMRDEWEAYRLAQGIGGGQPAMNAPQIGAPLPGANPLMPAPAGAPTAFPGLQRLPDDILRQQARSRVANIGANWMPQGLLG